MGLADMTSDPCPPGEVAVDQARQIRSPKMALGVDLNLSQQSHPLQSHWDHYYILWSVNPDLSFAFKMWRHFREDDWLLLIESLPHRFVGENEIICFESFLPVPDRLIPACEGHLAITLYTLWLSAGTLSNIVLKVPNLEFSEVDGLATCLNWEALALWHTDLSVHSSGGTGGAGAEAKIVMKRAWRKLKNVGSSGSKAASFVSKELK